MRQFQEWIWGGKIRLCVFFASVTTTSKSCFLLRNWRRHGLEERSLLSQDLSRRQQEERSNRKNYDDYDIIYHLVLKRAIIPFKTAKPVSFPWVFRSIISCFFFLFSCITHWLAIILPSNQTIEDTTLKWVSSNSCHLFCQLSGLFLSDNFSVIITKACLDWPWSWPSLQIGFNILIPWKQLFLPVSLK